MTVRYLSRASGPQPVYVCQKDGIRKATQICQSIPGADVDAAVGQLVVEAVTPMALEVAFGVQKELEARAAELDKLRYQHVERSHYSAELAQRRYMVVDMLNARGLRSGYGHPFTRTLVRGIIDRPKLRQLRSGIRSGSGFEGRNSVAARRRRHAA
jgi:hypothetical protein